MTVEALSPLALKGQACVATRCFYLTDVLTGAVEMRLLSGSFCLSLFQTFVPFLSFGWWSRKQNILVTGLNCGRDEERAGHCFLWTLKLPTDAMTIKMSDESIDFDYLACTDAAVFSSLESLL